MNSKKWKRYLVVGLAVLFVFIGLVISFGGCSAFSDPTGVNPVGTTEPIGKPIVLNREWSVPVNEHSQYLSLGPVMRLYDADYGVVCYWRDNTMFCFKLER